MLSVVYRIKQKYSFYANTYLEVEKSEKLIILRWSLHFLQSCLSRYYSNNKYHFLKNYLENSLLGYLLQMTTQFSNFTDTDLVHFLHCSTLPNQDVFLSAPPRVYLMQLQKQSPQRFCFSFFFFTFVWRCCDNFSYRANANPVL